MVRIMSEGIVARFLKCVTADMTQNNKTDIRCPCRRCKLHWVIDPDSGNLQAHLLRHGFMDGYTHWISDDEDDGDGEGGQHDDDHHHGENGRDDEESPRDGEGAEADRDDDDLDAEEQTTMEQRQAGCGTLMCKSFFSSRRVTPGLLLERKPSLRNLRKTRLLHSMKDAGPMIPG